MEGIKVILVGPDPAHFLFRIIHVGSVSKRRWWWWIGEERESQRRLQRIAARECAGAIGAPSLEEMADSKLYHFEEVSKHNVAKDCWLIIDGKVYDVTPFMDEHPGGDEVLIAASGKDATNDFEDIGHSTSARDMMAKYYIGQIDSASVPTKRAYVQPQQAPYNPDKTSEFVIKILQFLVPIMILGLAFVVRKYTKVD